MKSTFPEEFRAAIALPIYKDASFLADSVRTLEKATSSMTRSFQLIIAEDGSNSSKIVMKLEKEFDNLVYTQNDDRLGRGRALREIWSKIPADVYVYVDADMATSLERFDAYQKLLTLQREFDLVTGSRYLPESVTNRPRLRRLASSLYNWIIRIVFRTKVHDHQCGFKSFSRKLVETLQQEAKSDSWFWDTEVIVIARSRGFKIKEIPIAWAEKKGSKTPLKRLANDVWLHGTGLMKLFWRVYVHGL